VHRQHDPGPDLAGLIPITAAELLGLLRGTVVPPPRRDQTHRLHWSFWRRRHQHSARLPHQRSNPYAETAVGVRPEAGPVGVALFLLMGCLWSLVFAGFSYAIALKTRNRAAVNPASCCSSRSCS
jgi:hypothetical protein